MSELITQYTPYIFAVIAAIAVFAAGHFAGSSSAVTAKPADPGADVGLTATPAKIVEPAKVAENTKPLVQVPGEVLPVLAKNEGADKAGADATESLAHAPLADIQAAVNKATNEQQQAPALTGVDAEVAKTHDALDKIGLYGPARLQLVAAVRAGQVTADDVARSHPVQQEAKVPFGAIGLPSQDTTVATSAAPGQAE